jgi:tight adherence protein B
MDALALTAAATVLVSVLLFALAFLSGAAMSSQVRGRLQGVLGGVNSIIDGTTITPLRESRSVLGIYQFFVSGSWLHRMQNDLRLADSRLQPVDFMAIRTALAGLAFVTPYVFVGGAIGLLAGLAAGFFGFKLPQIWIQRRKTARAKLLEEQLPEALTFVANSLKAGFGLTQSLSLAAEQLRHPISTELSQTIHEMNVGSSAEEAFAGLSERNESYDLDIVVTAILVQRSAGGNLAEILGTVAETMRERVRIRGEINTLTAQQRLTGYVIGLLPFGVGAMFMVISPEYMTVLFTETMGRVMLFVGGFLWAVGFLVIKRILAIEV